MQVVHVRPIADLVQVAEQDKAPLAELVRPLR